MEGQLPQDKQAMLHTITQYLSNSPLERLKFRLERRLNSYVSVYGGLSEEMKAQVEGAIYALEREAADAQAIVDSSIAALKEGFI